MIRKSWARNVNPGAVVVSKKFIEDYYLVENDIRNIDVDGYNDADNIFIPTDYQPNLNKLEAIVVPLSSYEIINDRFQVFAENMLSTTSDAKHMYLILVVNNDTYKNVEIVNKEDGSIEKISPNVYPNFLNTVKKLKNVFKNVFIHNVNIYPDDDVYTLTTQGECIPKYGLVSGPNILFLGAMNFCKRFNTVLVIETDCILRSNWLPACQAYVSHCGTFLISGSTYDGIGDVRLNTNNISSFFHINGVAFYNTGSTVFQKVIEELDKYLIYYAKKVSPINAYDIVLSHMILTNLSSHKNFKFWRYVYRNITKNTLIINCSLKLDKKTPSNNIYRLFPSCVILHKKL